MTDEQGKNSSLTCNKTSWLFSQQNKNINVLLKSVTCLLTLNFVYNIFHTSESETTNKNQGLWVILKHKCNRTEYSWEPKLVQSYEQIGVGITNWTSTGFTGRYNYFVLWSTQEFFTGQPYADHLSTSECLSLKCTCSKLKSRKWNGRFNNINCIFYIFHTSLCHTVSIH